MLTAFAAIIVTIAILWGLTSAIANHARQDAFHEDSDGLGDFHTEPSTIVSEQDHG